MASDGIEHAVSLVLAPHYSTISVKSYNERANTEAEKRGITTITSVESWYDEPGFIDYWAAQLNRTYAEMPVEEKDKAVLIVSAHSLPEKIVLDDDPYVEQLEEAAKLISEKTAITNYEIGCKCKGNTPDP